MRLRRLEFEGIGSFADRLEIDFDTLGSAGMFLVEGPTGSGKSTILDAIVFALYGTVAGSASDIGRLDSHLRDRQHEPYVELDFSCGQTTYRLRRTPRHERDKRRGSGVMRDDGSVSLVRLAPDPAGLSHKAKEVGDWVIATVGLTKQQFVSTIVLAQGEFAAFLDADTGVRAQILEKVFGTQFYKQVEDQLTSMRKAALLRRTEADGAVLDAAHRCLGVLGMEEPTGGMVEAIGAEAARLAEDLGRARAELVQAQEAEEKAATLYAQAQDLAQRQARKRALLERQQELRARDTRVGQLRAALSAHERAVPAMAAVAAWRRAHDEVLAAERDEAQTLLALRAAGADQPDPRRLAELAELLGQLRGPQQVEAGIPAQREQVQRLAQAAADAEQAAAVQDAQCVEVAAELAALQQQAVDASEPRRRLAALQVQEALLRRQAAQWQQVNADGRALACAQQAVAEAAQELRDAEGAVVAARAAQARDHAAALAAVLVEGSPCAVCGATEHPDPARPTDGLTAPDLTQAEGRESAARDRWLVARQEHDRLAGRVQQLRSGLDREEMAVEADLRAVQEETCEVQERILAAQQWAERRERRTAESLELATLLTQARVEAERAAGQHAAAAAALAEAQATVARATQGHASVAEHVAAVTGLHAAMDAACRAAERVAGAAQALTRSEDLLTATLSGVGLPDVPAVEAALLEPEEAARLGDEVSRHEQDCSEVAGALRELEETDLVDSPDLDGLQEGLGACRTQVQACHETVVRLDHILGELAPARDVLVARTAQAQRVFDETAAVIRMADLATASRGEVTHRVRLSSFVLMRRFESVVEAANDRLDAISEGRYQLRVETQGLDNRGQAGLDLLIDDQRTERLRSTRSLSGGERFYVSLALALGLADVVRSESGGVQLGTLFIDEGFGSLDADVLEEVMDMLEQVRAGEDRVIGLVSHVDLLKQRIDPRISVRRDPQRPGVSTLTVSA